MKMITFNILLLICTNVFIGGKDLKYEWKRIQCNILICTPGRLLHHMNENPDFNCDYVQVILAIIFDFVYIHWYYFMIFLIDVSPR